MEGSSVLSFSSSSKTHFKLCSTNHYYYSSSSPPFRQTQLFNFNPKQLRNSGFPPFLTLSSSSSTRTCLLSSAFPVTKQPLETAAKDTTTLKDNSPKIDKSGRFCSPRAARELAILIVYASCLEGSDPIRLFDKRVNAKRAIIRDDLGSMVAAVAGSVVPSTITMHELEAVEVGLKLAREKGMRKIVVGTDSTTVVRLLKPRATCPWHVVQILRRIEASRTLFEEVRVTHVYREANRAADHLSKMLPTAECVEIVESSFAEDLKKIIFEDKSEPDYEFDKSLLLEYNHMSFGGPSVSTQTEEEAEELLQKIEKDSAIEAAVLSAPPKLVYSKLILRLAKKMIVAIVDGWDTHVAAIDKIAPPNWKSEPGGRVLEFCILHLAMAEITILGTRHQIIINEAVDLSKRFCDGTAPRVINGCLRTFVKDHYGKDMVQQPFKAKA